MPPRPDHEAPGDHHGNQARETPTVKSFALDLGGREIGFSAGQWVDLIVTIEGAEAVGGYSITSSPADQSTIRLAVKHDGSDHPVTNWLHDDAREGDLVEVSLGGDFTYTPDEARFHRADRRRDRDDAPHEHRSGCRRDCSFHSPDPGV